MARVRIFSLIGMCLLCFSPLKISALPVQSADFQVLSTLKRGWAAFHLTSWVRSADCSTLEGILCNAQGRVIRINLSLKALQGGLPAIIGSLPFLRGLSLTFSSLTGKIPPEICLLTNLTDLQLDQNIFTNVLPPCITNMRNLELISISHNYITGEIPAGIQKLKKLYELTLNSNSLGGSIPTGLCNVTTLDTLQLQANRLEGRIPSCLGNLKALKILNLASNKFYGYLPNTLFSLRFLATLDVSFNVLTGAVPMLTSEPTLDPTSVVYSIDYNYFSRISLTKVRNAVCPTSGGNCLLSTPRCTVGSQKYPSECLRFCNIKYGDPPPCNGTGVCMRLPTGTPACLCDPQYKPGRTPFTCVLF